MTLEMIRGDDHTFVYESAVALPDIAVLSFSYRKDPLVDKFIEFKKDGVLTNSNKTLTFPIDAGDTRKLKAGTLYYDVEFTAADGRIASTPRSSIELVADITVGATS